MNDRYLISPPTLPADDLSGALGQRLLRLLTRQAERDLQWLQIECAGRVAGHDYTPLVREPSRRPAHPLHLAHQISGCALQFAVLSRFGPDEEVAGHSRADLRAIALGLLRTLCATHPVADPPTECTVQWDRFDCLRHDFEIGLALWLLWEDVGADLRLLLARMLEHDADSWCDAPAPAQLYDDTQAESNAWSSGGVVLACCLLQHHPRREVWGDKAKELMISAYATEADVHRDHRVDGKPLCEWLTGPNAFPDYTVENHGIIHGDYLAAVSEKVRTAILYRLAGEPIPEAVLFNAAPVFDRLMCLSLPDGAHLYMQGSDYIARRLESFYQACTVAPLIPSPLRSAVFLRALDSLEQMEQRHPDINIGGWLGNPFDLGVHWGTTENYLIRRLFGPGADPLPEAQVNARLAGVHVCEPARYAVHRTATTLSSFSWHTTARASQVMGLTIALDRDTLMAPLPVGSMVGSLAMADGPEDLPRVVRHRVSPTEDGVGVVVELRRCEGGVTQHSAFVSLPDGTSVYLEERLANRALTLTAATCGNVAIYDDTRGPYQYADRTYYAATGVLHPHRESVFAGDWVNVDDRLGLIALGASGFRLRLSTDYMHSPYGDQWRLGLLSFVPVGPVQCRQGERLSAIALVICPHQSAVETEALARTLTEGWDSAAGNAICMTLGGWRVYADFRTQHCGWTSRDG